MKKIIKITTLLTTLGVLFTSCKKFEEINNDPLAASLDQVQVEYFINGSMSGWLNQINSAVQVAESKIASGNVKPYTNNLLQVARIWRAYLMSELSDNFGPIPINAFQGVNPQPASVKDVYYFLLEELKDASSKLDVSVVNPDVVKKEDPVYMIMLNGEGMPTLCVYALQCVYQKKILEKQKLNLKQRQQANSLLMPIKLSRFQKNQVGMH